MCALYDVHTRKSPNNAILNASSHDFFFFLPHSHLNSQVFVPTIGPKQLLLRLLMPSMLLIVSVLISLDMSSASDSMLLPPP